jgi:tRNA A37 threonylcarbamoyladenosine dehydratase
MDQYSRTRMLLGEAAMEKLRASRVAVFGLGGVGGYVVEALARSGVGALDLVDNDVVCLTNLNRQILATHASLGRYKVDAAAERVADIDPTIAVRTYRTFYLPENEREFDFTQYDYVVDAVDTVAAKLSLVQRAQAAGTPILSALGTGNKLDPAKLEIGDIYATSVCPLARVMRRELRRRGVERLKVLWSREEPLAPLCPAEEEPEGARRAIPGSTAFVPPAAGLLIAAEVVRDLLR